MALIIPPGFAQVTIPFRHSAVPREAVITFGVDAEGYGGDWEALAFDLLVAWEDTFGDEQDSEVTIGPVRLSVGQDGGDPLQVVGSNSTPGDRTAAMLPSNVALLVQKRSLTGGRRGRGRFYIPWIVRDEEATDVGTVDNTARLAFQAHAVDFLGRLANSTGGMTNPAPMVILHDSGGLGPEPGPSEVVSLTVDPLVATQRRRLAR